MDTLELAHIKEALSGNAAAFRCVTELQPAGGAGDKVFPPTYSGGEYATDQRHVNGEEVTCVLLDSVQSQANRMELALLSEWEYGRATLPVITVDFTGADLPKHFRVTSLDAPHRIADALLRDSELDGVMFRQSETGKRLDTLDARNATALFELCPTAPGLRDVGLHRATRRVRGQVPAHNGIRDCGVSRPAGQTDQQPHRPGRRF